MIYVDTSIFVAILTNEPAASRSIAWLAQQPPGYLYISDWTTVEFSSALALKLRTQQIGQDHRQIAATAFARLVQQSLSIVPITPADYAAAAQLCAREALALRAGDSLHVAIALRNSLAMATLDRATDQACKALNLTCESP
jgi:uncharacterized protein